YNDYNSAADCYVPYGRGWGRDPILRRKAGLGPRPGRRRAPGSAELRLAAASAVTGKVCALRDMPSGGRAVVGARDDAVVVVSGSGSAPKGDEGRPQSASEQNSACSEVVGGRSGGASCCWAAPPSLLFGADFGSPFAFQAQDLRVPGVGVAPAEVGVDPSGQHGVVEVVGVVEHELPQRPEVRLDRIGPGAVGGRKAQFDVVLGAPRLDLLGLVGREVVQDDVDHLAVGSGRPAALDRGEAVPDRFLRPADAPHRVVADGVDGVELPHAAGLVVVGPLTLRLLAGRPAAAADGVDGQWPELIEGEAAVGMLVEDPLD